MAIRWPGPARGRRAAIFAALFCGLALHAQAPAAQASPRELELPADFLERAVVDPQTCRFILPDGQPVVGKIELLERANGRIRHLAGALQHPAAGTFSFTREAAAGSDALTGEARFTGRPTHWVVRRDEGDHGSRLVEQPVPDAFRPQALVMPRRPPGPDQAAKARAAAEAALRRELSIETTATGELRVGLVEVRRSDRSLRFPAKLNLRQGPVEYAVVAESGKCHESLLATAASPRDIHVALLLLGVKPAACSPQPDRGLTTVPAASVEALVEWQADGSTRRHPLAELVALADPAMPGAAADPLSARAWHCNGSRFTGAGFGALLEGSVISLVADQMALLNNPGPDRDHDEIHVPRDTVLPALGTPVTVILSPVRPASLHPQDHPGPP